VKLRFLDTDLCQILVADCIPVGYLPVSSSAWIVKPVLVVVFADKVHHFVAGQRFATSVRRNMAEHAMFDFVPFAGARGKVTDPELKAGVVSQSL
jgi:hypothetical protein